MTQEQYLKVLLVKGLRLQKYLDAYKVPETKQEAYQKLVNTWGEMLAGHFLMKHDKADDLINSLDSQNLEFFVNKF